MTYINYMNQLWRSAMMSPIPASEIALFAYLVNECNKRFWQMPFACSTTRISDDLRISRQTVITAREHLTKRRLISFTEGKSRHVPSTYMLINWTDDLTVELTDGLTHDLTHLKDKDKDNYLRKSSENFDERKEYRNGAVKRKENSRLCPIPTEGADYDTAF